MDSSELKKQRAFFDKVSHQYKQERIVDPPFHTQCEIQEIITRMKNIPRGDVADFGAGSGRVTIPLLQKGYTVCAIDVSDGSLKRLQSLAQKLTLRSVSIARTLPSHEKFSSIVGADILHHVSLDEVIPKLHTALLPRGKVIFSEPCAFNIAWYLLLPFLSDWSVEKGIVNCRYFHLKKKFKQYGFQTVSISGFGLLPTPLLNWSKKLCIVNARLGNVSLVKFFSYRYIIEATK